MFRTCLLFTRFPSSFLICLSSSWPRSFRSSTFLVSSASFPSMKTMSWSSLWLRLTSWRSSWRLPYSPPTWPTTPSSPLTDPSSGKTAPSASSPPSPFRGKFRALFFLFRFVTVRVMKRQRKYGTLTVTKPLLCLLSKPVRPFPHNTF